MPSQAHELINDTLVRRGDGIYADCTCGWSSPYGHFTSLAASATFREHVENATDMREGPPPRKKPDVKIELVDRDGRPSHSITVPQDVLDASNVLAAWLRTQPANTQLNGVRLVLSLVAGEPL